MIDHDTWRLTNLSPPASRHSPYRLGTAADTVGAASLTIRTRVPSPLPHPRRSSGTRPSWAGTQRTFPDWQAAP